MADQPPTRQTFRAFRDEPANRDLRGHVESRAALLNLLRDDLRVRCLVETHGELWSRAVTMAHMLEILARAEGYPDRRRFLVAARAAGDSDEEVIEGEEETLGGRDSTELLDTDRAAAHEAEAEATMRDAVSELVYETWGLPRDHPRERWDWLVEDLVVLWKLELSTMVSGGHAALLVFLAEDPSPSIQVDFRTRDDESPEDARRRLKAVYDEAVAALAPRERPRGTILDVEDRARDVEYLYRHVLKDPRDSQRLLAREYRERVLARDRAMGRTKKRTSDNRGTVQSAIKRARRLLAEVPAPLQKL